MDSVCGLCTEIDILFDDLIFDHVFPLHSHKIFPLNESAHILAYRYAIKHASFSFLHAHKGERMGGGRGGMRSTIIGRLGRCRLHIFLVQYGYDVSSAKELFVRP